MLTFDQIKELIQLVREGHLQGLEIEERSGQRIKITGRNALPEGAQIVGADMVRGNSARPELPEVVPALPPEEAEPGEQDEEAEEPGRPAGAHVVTSPIVGTFYGAPSPESDPYVQPGDRVRKGQVLCIVEAMKLMNEIEAELAGTIEEILVEDGKPVEYGDPLFVIRKA